MILLGTKDNTGLVATHEENGGGGGKSKVRETERKEGRLLTVVAPELHSKSPSHPCLLLEQRSKNELENMKDFLLTVLII